MKVVLPGGSGQVGTILARAFTALGHRPIVLSRRPRRAPWPIVAWDGVSLGPWVRELEGADAVINLAGRSVNCRYNAANRREIMDSRVRSVRVLAAALRACDRPPPVWLQASTATIYAHRYDGANDESDGLLGGTEPQLPDTWRFSIDVATAWEAELDRADVPATRKVALRSALTLSPDRGGVFDTLLALVRLGLGGRAGDGRQYVSWIHEADFVRAVLALIEDRDSSGPVNVSATVPLPNAEFMRELRRAWGSRIGMPSARWMLEVGALLLRTETELVLKSRRVVPGKLLARGFEFRYPEWPAAARDLCRRRRRGNRTSHAAPPPAGSLTSPDARS